MKKILAVIFALVLLVGCGGKAEKATESRPPSEPPRIISKSTITDEEVKTLLVGKKIGFKYKYNPKADIVSEHEPDDEFVISEVTELTYTTTSAQEDAGNGSIIEIEGTFKAYGSPYKGDQYFYETVDPAVFSMTIRIKDNVAYSALFGAQPPYIKPAKPIALDNLYETYMSQDSFPDIDYFPDPDGPKDYQETVIFDGKPLFPNLRMVVVEDPFADAGFMERDFLVDIYDGENYLCTGTMSIRYSVGKIFIGSGEFVKLR